MALPNLGTFQSQHQHQGQGLPQKNTFTENSSDEREEEMKRLLQQMQDRKTKNTEEQEQQAQAEMIQRLIMEMRDTGVYRVNRLKSLEESQSISVDFGKELFIRLDELNRNIARIANVLDVLPPKKSHHKEKTEEKDSLDYDDPEEIKSFDWDEGKKKPVGRDP